MTEHPHDYSIPGLFHDLQDLTEMIGPALAALPAAAIPDFLNRLASAAVAHQQGDEDALGRLFFGVITDYRLSFNQSYRQAVKEIDRADPPEETDREELFDSLRARR